MNVMRGLSMCVDFQRDWVREGLALSEIGNGIKIEREEDQQQPQILQPSYGSILNTDEIIVEFANNGKEFVFCLSGNNSTLVLDEDDNAEDKHKICFPYSNPIQLGNFFTGTHALSFGDEHVVVDLLGGGATRKGFNTMQVKQFQLLQRAQNKNDAHIMQNTQKSKTKVVFLMINFDEHSQNNMFANLAINLPRR
tara:strand:+ start:831 stop:1415 length:585 start_codon:yes stop_codon:yes gene_type:complete